MYALWKRLELNGKICIAGLVIGTASGECSM